jgi:DNA modification methylase
MSNCTDRETFWAHFKFLIAENFRITTPGRIVCVHVMQLPTSKTRDGFIGIRDFRGEVVRAYMDAGFYFHSEVMIRKDPVSAMQRSKSIGLLHKQVVKDSTISRMALADYVVVFRKPGENQVRIKPDVDRPTWIQWARGVWYDIREFETLNTAVAKDDPDERHIAPLQLGLIERCVRLWSNAGELVLSPFALTPTSSSGA